MITRLRAQFKRLRWKLTWSYTWVAALTFLVIETALLTLLMSLIGFNPLRRDTEVYNNIVAPVLVDDIRPITMAHLRNQPVDTAALQADLEQILGLDSMSFSRLSKSSGGANTGSCNPLACGGRHSASNSHWGKPDLSKSMSTKAQVSPS